MPAEPFRMEPDLITEFETLLLSIPKRKKDLSTPAWFSMITLGVMSAVYFCAFLFAFLVMHKQIDVIGSIVGALLGSGVLWCYFMFFSTTRKNNVKQLREELLRLTQFDDVRAVPLLLDELWSNDPEIRSEVHVALLRLLPQMQTTDAHLLNAKQRDKLYNLPFNGEFIAQDFRIAALYAIGQVGDSRALQIVKKKGATIQQYHQWVGSTVDEYRKFKTKIEADFCNPDMNTALDKCIAAIEARLAAEQVGATLLRASTSPAAISETLLRPAAAADATEPQQLLRATPHPPDSNS